MFEGCYIFPADEGEKEGAGGANTRPRVRARAHTHTHHALITNRTMHTDHATHTFSVFLANIMIPPARAVGVGL